MIYKLVSINKVISKVFTDLDLQEGLHRTLDFVEWGAEALKKIGAFPAMTTRVVGKEGIPLLEIDNYQAKLPGDLHTINQVAYADNVNGPFYPMRYATGSFSGNHEVTNATTDSTSDQNRRIKTENGTVYSGDYTYVITGGYIKTNLKTGYLMISYQGIPVDENGFPMIPDDESFLEAIYWYINMKLTYPEWKAGRVRDAVYYDAKSSWNYYRKQAYGNAMMPDGDQLEAIKNIWLKLVPEINASQTFYSAIGQQELFYNNNYK